MRARSRRFSGVSARFMVAALPALVLSACGGEAPAEHTDEATQPTLQTDYGSWLPGIETTDVLAVHAAVMPLGYVFFFGGSQYEPTRLLGDGGTRPYQYRAWVPQPSGTPGSQSVISGPQGTNDLFCAGHAMTADGKLLIAGGNEQYIYQAVYPHGGHYTGINAVWLFDGLNFTSLPSMGHGRWYPSVIPMNSAGDLLIVEGHGEQAWASHDNTAIEVYGNTSGTWTKTTFAQTYDSHHYYPRAHLLSDGTTFVASPHLDLSKSPADRNKRLQRSGSSIVSTDAGPAYFHNSDLAWLDFKTTTVLMPYRLNANGTHTRDAVMIVNGIQPAIKDLGPGATLNWVATPPRVAPPFGSVQRRIHGNATILPTGDILLTGGVPEQNQDVAVHAEIYRTDLGVWDLATKAAIPRNYHNTALLLPDGRIWTASGNPQAFFSGWFGENRTLQIEIYQPWYYGHPSRPTISSIATGTITHGTQFCVQTPQFQSVSKVAIMKLGSVTHGFNADQRYVQLPIINKTTCGGGVRVQIPADGDLTPKGFYHLFVSTPIFHAAGSHIPSAGAVVRVQ